MSACGAIGALVVGGRVVGQLRCELEASHVDADIDLPHTALLEWTDEREPDLDLFDPAERFDVAVEIPRGGACMVGACLLEGGHDGLHDDVFGDDR